MRGSMRRNESYLSMCICMYIQCVSEASDVKERVWWLRENLKENEGPSSCRLVSSVVVQGGKKKG